MKVLTEYEAEQFLEREGFPVIKRKLVHNEDELIEFAENFGFPLVLKNPFILHKTEKNAVILNVYRNNMNASFKKLNSDRVLVQKQEEGLQILIGIKKDDVFNHVLAFGLGGIYTEVLKDVSFRILPVSNIDIKEMISETKVSKLLNYRNNKINVEEIERILLKCSELVKKFPNIKELDINPLIANNEKIVIADARIVFE